MLSLFVSTVAFSQSTSTSISAGGIIIGGGSGGGSSSPPSGKVSVTSKSLTPKRNICYTSETIKVGVFNIENLYTGSGDSVDLGKVYFYSQHYYTTLADSLFIYESGKQVGKGKFVSGQLPINLNRWLGPGKNIDIEVYCKTLNVSVYTQMYLTFNTLDYTIGSWSLNTHPNLQTNWFDSYDCTQPILSDSKNIVLNSPICYDKIGDTLTTTSVKIENPNKDTMVINSFDLYLDNIYWSQAEIDSVFIFNSKNEKLTSTIFYNSGMKSQKAKLNLNLKIPGLKSVEIRFVYKFSSLGQTPYVEIPSINWDLNKKNQTSSIWLGTGSLYLVDCKPYVALEYFESKRSDKLCTGDHVGVYPRVNNTIYPVKTHQYFVNGKLFKQYNNEVNYDYVSVPLTYPTTKVMVKITDTSGRFAMDSVMLNVEKAPIPKMFVSSMYMCHGGYVTFTGDTVGLEKWAWNWETPSNKVPIKNTVFYPGYHNFFAVAKNGCIADTSVNIYEIPAQDKPSITISDWVLGSAVKADSFIWAKRNDTTGKFEPIKNSNKMFINEFRKGYYMVTAFNKGNCSAESDITPYDGYTIKDSMPHVKLMISASKPGTKFCSSEQVIATRKILEPINPVVKEEWFLNGSKISFTPNQLFDGMQYSVPLTTATVKLKVVVTDKAGKVASDSTVLTIYKSPKALVKLSASSFCSGNTVTITADTTGISKYAWGNDKLLNSYPIKLSVDQSGSYKFTVVSKDGCLADTAVMAEKLQTPDRPTGLSNDWTIGSSVQAGMYAWYRMNDTTAKFEPIKNSNKQFLRELRKGYYYVDIFNNNGCSNGSEVFYHKGYIIMDSMPHVKLRITAPKPGTKFCYSDKIIAGRQILETAFPAVQEEWFLNGTKIPFTKNQTFDAMEYPVPMNVGNTKLKIVVTDKIGKTASDSFEFTVLPKPKIILDHPNTKTCYGGTVNICLDTARLANWSFNGVQSKSPKNNFQVFESRPQTISITSISGCTADTGFNVVMYPGQERLTINSADSLLWVNQKAYEIEWFYESVSIGYDNQVIQSKKSGFYQAIATSQFGCTSTSDLYYFKYVAPKDPVIPKDTTGIIIGAENPSIVFCKGEFKPTLTLINVDRENVASIEWFVDGKSIFSCKNVQMCGLVPKSLWLVPGARTIIVRATLSNKTIEADTAYITVVGPMKTKLFMNGPSGECVGRTIRLGVQDSMNYKLVTWSNGSNGKSFTVLNPNGSFFATTTDYNGCLANTDTIALKTLVLPKPNLASSSCTLFADIDWQYKGSWEWVCANKVATTTESEITAPSGKAWWKVRFSYGGCYSEYSSAVFVECISAGLNNVNQKLGFRVYPNPSIDQFTVESSLEKGEAQLIDMQGRVVKTFTIENGSNTVYREGLAAGVYSIIFNGDATRIVFQ